VILGRFVIVVLIIIVAMWLLGIFLRRVKDRHRER
jgi:septation ring formation regulator EzrA